MTAIASTPAAPTSLGGFGHKKLVLAVAVIQSLVLGYMVWDRVSLLRSDREITLDVIPVDPRSLFRGDYVILNYDISQVDGSALKPPARRGDTLYVTIAKAVDGKWKAVTVSPERPTESAPGQVVISGRVKWTRVRRATPPVEQPTPGTAQPTAGSDDLQQATPSPSTDEKREPKTWLRMQYGIESYFVPEDTGKAIEKSVQEKKIQAVVAVDMAGRSALKALVVDGKRVHEQPWW